ncbi:MAG: DUF1289 domain-containing protein [Pseudomonadales bacterium]|nr:DUF1289 domain-containing protein [Pseudomonadales bacterium]NRA14123.1 DUF1289 domain-containing protein [Oceanospirillaceae bacterium]
MNDAQLIASAEMSPCVGVCKKDQTTGWCFGCGRTDSEISQWQGYDEQELAEVKDQLIIRVQQTMQRRRAERGANRRSRRA